MTSKFRGQSYYAQIGILILSLVFIGMWSYFTICKFYALNSDVWDLGYAENLLYSAMIDPGNLSTVFTRFIRQGVVYLLAPIAISKSIPALLIFQSFVIWFPAFLLFHISKLETKKPVESLLIGCSYLLYFPLAGANWSDFHFQTMFAFFYLLGYLLYLKDKPKLSFLLFFVSGMVRFPYMGIVAVSAIGIILPDFIRAIFAKNFSFSRNQKMLLILILVSLLFVIFQFFWLRSAINSFVGVPHGTSLNPLISLDSKLIAFSLLLGPLLFLPLLSKKWILPIILFIMLVFFLNNKWFEYPLLFQGWYSIAIAPFLFLGLIDIISLLNGRHPECESDRSERRKITSRIHPLRQGKNVILSVFFVLCILSVAFQPYGPLNDHSFNDFNLSEKTNVNWTQLNSVRNIINLIPTNESYVLVQNNLPQLFPRVAIRNIMVSPFNIGPDVTPQDISQNRFPFYGITSQGYVPINYSIADFNTVKSLMTPPMQEGFPTMFEMEQMLLNSTIYGIYAEENGIILLKRGYNGTVAEFHPMYYNVNLRNLVTSAGSFNNNIISFTSPLPYHQLWAGPYIQLPPGKYSANLEFKAFGNQHLKFTAVVGSQNDSGVLKFLNTTEYNVNVTDQNAFQSVSIQFNSTKFLLNTQFYLIPQLNYQSIIIDSMHIVQLSPN